MTRGDLPRLAAGDHVGPWLDRYRTGELSNAERAVVESHLAACPSCDRELAELRAFSEDVARGFEGLRSAQPLPDPLWDRQRRRILERTVAVPPRSARARWPRLAPQAALAALAVVGLAVVFRAGVRSPDDAESLMTRSEEMARVPDSDGPRASKLAPRGPVDAEDAAGRDRPPASSVGADEQAMLEMEEEEEEEEKAADVAAPAAPQRSGVTPRGRTPSEPVGSEGRTGAQRQDLPEEREAAQPRAGAAAGAAKAMTAQRSADALSRFRDSALAALEARDRLLAEEALVFWRDSLASGAELPEGEREEAVALADSLRALLRRP